MSLPASNSHVTVALSARRLFVYLLKISLNRILVISLVDVAIGPGGFFTAPPLPPFLQ